MKAPRRRVSPYPRRSKSGGRKEGHNRDKQDQVIQTTNGRFVSCVSLCFPCYAQGAEIHEIFGKGKRFSERVHTSLILGLDGLLSELTAVFTAPGATQRLWSSVLPGVVPSLEKLRSWGLNLIVVSNSDGTVEESLIEQGLRPYFSWVVDSHWVGFEKPDARIFQHALSLGDDPAERTLHVGDLYHADVLGARSVGIHPILLDPFGDWPELDCERAADLPAVVQQLAAVFEP